MSGSAPEGVLLPPREFRCLDPRATTAGCPESGFLRLSRSPWVTYGVRLVVSDGVAPEGLERDLVALERPSQ